MSLTIDGRVAADVPKALAAWLTSRLEGALDVTVGDVKAPSANGFSNITLLFDATWQSRGVLQSGKFVARVEPTGEALFPTYDVVRQFVLTGKR